MLYASKAKAVATTAVKAATKRLKNTLSKPNTKSKNTQDSDIESNVPRASTTISKKSSSSKPLVMDVDEYSDKPQPAPPKKSSGSKATVIDIDEDSDDDSTSSSGTSPMQEQSDEIELDDLAYLEIENLIKGWSSPVYAFFQPTPAVDKARKNMQSLGLAALESVKGMNPGDACKSARRYLRDGNITTAFKRVGKKGTVTYSHCTHTSWETRAEIVHWVSESGRPFAIVKDRGFQSLMKTGRPGYYLPHPTTVARDVKTVFAKTHQQIASMLQEYEGDINFATDAWSSPNHRAYIAITVHLEHRGEPLTFLLDFVKVATSHSGENLARVFAEVLAEFGIEEKILSITADNASANDTMISALETLPNFPGELNRTQCFNHIINLVAKSLIKLFDVSSSKNTGDMDDIEKALIDLAAGVDMEDLQARLKEAEEGGELERDSEELVVDMMDGLLGEEEELRKQIIPVQQVLVKLRKTSFKIINSTTLLLPQWRSILEELNQLQTVIPRDVSTHWNSTCDLLGYCIEKEHKKAYRSITSAEEDNGLGQYTLSKKEWAIAVQLHEVLDVLRDATVLFSRKTPNLSTVLPVLDDIDQMGLNNQLDPAIRAAVSLAKKTLNKYYGKFDYSKVYRIVMVLHPRHKLNYFKTAEWPTSWVDAAKEIVREVYERDYKGRRVEGEMEIDKPSSPVLSKSKPVKLNQFDELPALQPPQADELGDELDRYLSMDIEATKDVLGWWYEKRKNFPMLYHMALWSLMGLIHDEDVLAVAKLPEVEDPEQEAEDIEMPDGYDDILGVLSDM
ncbi:hypothetical protein D9758_016948 [Tetrapyrgos nigripes]|uniref:Transposase n=1 Tax=Tetrapyrgos nigripes TaxID=182062 RepID=A0A8H5C1P2_9AGAR|nr:hypothetical protein D9758_016948 [Tetrapyrgos nigripes]